MSESKTYRIKSDLVKKIKDKHMKYIIEKKEVIDEAQIVNALVLKGLEVATNEDVAKYMNLREERKIK